MGNAVFVDWLTASQCHPEGGLPVIVGGLNIFYDSTGIARRERACSAPVQGSFDTSVRVQCDGFRVWLSGNVGRFARQDNLFNLGWDETVRAAGRILASVGLPPFSATQVLPDGSERRGAVVSRLDLTCNFAAGSDPQARAVVRWVAGQSIARMKRGQAGDESVWFSNTRYMFKLYNKAAEMLAHGCSIDEVAYQFALNSGIVRAEVELKKRLLSDAGLQDLGNITQDKLEDLFREHTEILRRVDRSDEPDILAALPSRSRAYAAAWMRGEDLRTLVSRATLFRHAKVCREYGLDILEPRNVVAFPHRVTVIELAPLEVPDWYELYPKLRVVGA